MNRITECYRLCFLEIFSFYQISATGLVGKRAGKFKQTLLFEVIEKSIMCINN